MTSTRPEQPQAETANGPGSQAAGEPDQLDQLLGRVLRSEGSARVEGIDQLLSAIEGATAEAAPFLERHLDEGTFETLGEELGQRVHTAAVTRLIALGYPHALRISPEALERWRASTGTGGTSRWARLMWSVALAGLIESGIAAFLSRGAGSDFEGLWVGVLHAAPALVLGAAARFGSGVWGSLARMGLLLGGIVSALIALGVAGIAFGSSAGHLVAALPTVWVAIGTLWLATFAPPSPKQQAPAKSPPSP